MTPTHRADTSGTPSSAPTPSAAEPSTAPDPATVPVVPVDDNGGWCWFQDERALVAPASGRLLIGSVASQAGADGDRRGGDVDLQVVDLDAIAQGTGEDLSAALAARTITLHEGLESDDHDNPALWHRADGRWLAVYSRHKGDERTRFRISEPGDPTRWGEEDAFRWTPLFGADEEAAPFTPGRGVTYQNLHQLDGVLYCFVRAINDDPCYLVSHDDGSSWEFGGRLLTRPKIGYVNGYARYASGKQHGTDDRIDVIITEYHPRDYNTSIWHGYLAGGALHRADGTVVGPLGRGLEDETPRAEDLTPVFTAGSTWGGSVMTHAWTTDLRRGADGALVALFTARADDTIGTETSGHEVDPIDHRFFHGVLRPGESQWQVRQLAVAGPQLMPHEEDYTGLGAIDPDDLDTIYLSTPVDPRDGTPWTRHEIVRGHTADGGATWEWTPLTKDSAVDNFRPIAVPGDPSRQVLTWYRGSMDSSQNYRAEVVVRAAARQRRAINWPTYNSGITTSLDRDDIYPD
jgi:hypothetical protein